MNQTRASLTIRILHGILAFLACSAVALAQTNTGAIEGWVYDETLAVMPNVAVTALDEARGTERSTQTNDAGEYALAHLPPGVYTLRFEAPNFAPLTVEAFEVMVGETVTYMASLSVATAQVEVVVSAEAARTEIETQRVHQADHIDSVRIENLPINRRDYLDLALLTPGVVNTNYIANAIDRRIAPTPTSGLGIGGTAGRSNTFMIDGLDNLYNSGAVRSQISQEAVQEFQVNRSTFSAEQGGAPGGTVNIVTKGGTNEVHGTVFGVLRNRRFQARNHFDPGRSAYTRAQSGVSLGGPVAKNKTFFFAAYERLDRNESQIVPLLADPTFLTALTPSQQALADVLGANPLLRPLVDQIADSLIPANTPGVLELFDENSGVFPFSEDRGQLVARLDHSLRDGHNLFFRGNWTGQTGQNSEFGALTARSRGRNSNVNDFAVALGDTYVINPRWVSETRIGAGYHDFGVYPTDPHGPAVDIQGFGDFGRDFILPTRVVERVFQVRQNFMRVSGRQTVKFGVDFNPMRDGVRSETFLSGRFIFGEAIPLSVLIDQGVGPGTADLVRGILTSVGASDLVGNIDDPITSLQAYALGLPIIYQQGFGDPSWAGWANRTNFFAEDSIRITPSLRLTLGLRYEMELKTRFPRDYNNIAPRAGFAWSPNPRTVVRGGYGIYFARIDGQIAFVNDLLGDRAQIAQVFVPLTGAPGLTSPLTNGPLTSAEIWGSLRERGILGQRGVTLDDLAIHGINPGPEYPLKVGFRVAKDTVNPYAQQASFEIQRQIGGYAMSAAYNFNRGGHLIRPLDPNPFQAGTQENGLPIVGFHDPLILQDNVYGSWSRSFYHAMILHLKKRFAEGFTISAHHTWSKAIDENTDYNSSYEPHIPWDARNELALSHFHRGHRFVANVVTQSPWKAGRGRGFGHNLLSDFVFSGILVARTFAPFNLNAGYDTIGDRHTDTHRPWGLGRNVGVGPAFFGMDIRLTRDFALSEKVDLRVVAEAFNVLNRTNFKGVNGVVGSMALEEVPDRPTGRRGPVTEPFSFSSAFDPRQFQFTVRISF